MGKKQSSNIYETDQSNKKHRKKSKKLEKREQHKKDKKKNKKEKHKKRKIEKYIKKGFKENKKHLDYTKLFGDCLDLDEILKQIKKILELNPSAVSEVPELFRIMEENKKEINIGGIEDKASLKHILKLFKNLKITQSTKNAFSFRITNLDKKRDPRVKYTTEINDVISESLDSYYLLVKMLFEFVNYMVNNPKEDEDGLSNDDENLNEGISEEDSDNSSEDESFIGQEYVDKKKLKELDRQKMEMDYENDLLEEKLGKNSELINKAFNKIMQEDTTNFNNKSNEEEEELVGPPVPKFLEATMSLINTGEDDRDVYHKIISTNTYSSSKDKKSLPCTSQKGKIEPYNKESYDRLINYERERMKNMREELEDYEAKYRGTSLLEEYQQIKKEKKNLEGSSSNPQQRKGFDKEKDMNVGRIDSKRALSIMRDSKGLQGRFEVKEKYIGY